MTNKIKSLLATLFKYLEEDEYRIPEPIDPNELDKFKLDYFNTFKIEIDQIYLDFLNTCDGLEYNGVRFYSSFNPIDEDEGYGIFEANELWDEGEESSFIYLGESDLDLFVIEKNQNRFLCISRYTEDVEETFDNFDEMLEYALKLMIE
jgi:hypothetical protein